MKPPRPSPAACAFLLAAMLCGVAAGQRIMEPLGRGLVAVRKGGGETFLSWRLLGTDPEGVAFHLYRGDAAGEWERMTDGSLRTTCFTDKSSPRKASVFYSVRAVVSGKEEAAGDPFVLPANGRAEPAVRIPIRRMPRHIIHFVWVGDLDGDGEYDYVLDRLPIKEGNQFIEAYGGRGKHLWTMDLGPQSTGGSRYEPAPAQIGSGHWDGLTVYDMDSDGRAEVLLRTADGVVFADGKTVSGLGENGQAVSVIDGLTGAELARARIPEDYLSDGPMAAHFGVGHLDGVRPSLLTKMKNRIGDKGFNLMVCAWDFSREGGLAMRWKWLRGEADAPDFHQIRIFDVDGDGKDEFCDGGYALNADGTFRYKVGGAEAGVKHGDRFHLGDFDPQRKGLEGFAVQQDNPSGLRYLIYDAATGNPIHLHKREGKEDVGRGCIADIDPAEPGAEYRAFDGIHRIGDGKVVSEKQPWPNFSIYWDGDLLRENLDRGIIDKWVPEKGAVARLFSISSTRTGVGGASSFRGAPFFYGDILGDWREEVVTVNGDRTELIICTTDIPTEISLPTLPHNPAYRAAMTCKGYYQSNHTDYFIGEGMSRPPRAKIRTVPPRLSGKEP